MSPTNSEPTEDEITEDYWRDLVQRLDYQELSELRADVTQRMKDIRDTGITQLRATIAEQAALLGVELKDLVPKKTRKKRKARDDDQA